MTDVQKIAFDTLKAGAPGLSDQTREVLAGIIARKVALSTTPARAEAQDEGAADALKPLFTAVDLSDAYNKSDRPKRAAKDFLLDSELRGAVAYLRAHPSPTPAATVCDACGDKGYVESEGGDGEGWPSRPEIEACSRCAPTPAADDDRVREAIIQAVSKGLDNEWKDWEITDAILAALKSEGK